MNGALRARLVVGLKAGLITGIAVTGVGGRLTMRLIALGQPRVPAFTLRGSLVVVAAGTVVGAAGGVVYAAVRPYLPGRGLARGLLFGILVPLVGWPLGFPLPATPPGGRFAAGDVVARIAFVLLSLIAGATLEWVSARLGARGSMSAAAPAAGRAVEDA